MTTPMMAPPKGLRSGASKAENKTKQSKSKALKSSEF